MERLLEAARLYLYGLMLLAWGLGLGCEFDRRDVQLLTSSATGGLEPGVESPLVEGHEPDVQTEVAAGSFGAACQQDTDCNAGNCVDGVCCDSPCTELCAACNLPGSPGVCSAAPNDTLCPPANCQGLNSECRPLGAAQGALNCEAVGVCRASAECAAMPAVVGTPCQQGTGTCDGQGACLVPDKGVLGVACAADGDCAEGHCVASGADGARVCCDAACDGVCQACSAGGRCEETPATDARCTAVTCPADNVCRDYADAITDNLCSSFGQCRGALDCVTPNFFTGLRPDAQCVCDPASGGCALAAGTSCQQAGDCASGACFPTPQGNLVCCSGQCAAGLFCSSTGTGCVQCEGTQIECEGNSRRTCNGGAVATTACPNGCTPGTGCNALPPVGFLCGAGQCAAGGTCQIDTQGQARCCVRDCAAEAKVCSPSGSCDCPPGQVTNGASCLLQAGDPCQTTTQCQAGMSCVDGVCCGEACGGYCERCQAGTGLCAAVPAGQQEVDAVSGNNCNNGFVCTGTRNGCKAGTGQACSSTDGSDCVSGACQATAGGGARVCCSQACGAGLSCRSSGQGCVQCESAAQCGNGCDVAQGTCNALSIPGATCSVASQCSTNACVAAVDGNNLRRCCANCGAGQLCNAQGQCTNPQSGLGGSCNNDADCGVGVCVANVCCATACDATCQVCGGGGRNCQSNGLCDAFSCANADPPGVGAILTDDMFEGVAGPAPGGTGGTVNNGRYVPVSIDVYGGNFVATEQFTNGISVPAYEFFGRSVQISAKDVITVNPITGFLPDVTYTGTFTINGSTLSFQVGGSCNFTGVQLNFTQTVQFTANQNTFRIISLQDAHTLVIDYSRQ